VGTNDVGEDYVYTVWAHASSLMMECADSDGTSLYHGKLGTFDGAAVEENAGP